MNAAASPARPRAAGGPDRALAVPPHGLDARGQPRTVGVELEVNGLTLDAMAQRVADTLGLRVRTRGRYERVLEGDPAGDWCVELDFRLLKQQGRVHRDTGSLADELGNWTEDALAWLAESVVPLELVSPPLPLARLPDVERVIVALRSAGAKGTSDRLVNAFGLHLNPQVPGEDTASVLVVLRAFLCLHDWLRARAHVNVARRMTAYIDPYPSEYVQRVIAADYRPDRTALIDDYLRCNPTRNRALDLLPLFAHFDEARVRAAVDDPLIKPRPAFHYRLPNCEIDRPGWGLYPAWNDWVAVERLAADTDALAQCCARYRRFLRRPLRRWFGDWRRESAAFVPAGD